MFAAIDAGSNTLRLLIGQVAEGKVVPELYLRRICRLAGGFSQEKGLSPDAMERTLLVFAEFAEACCQAGVSNVKAVGTEAFRKADNGEAFCKEVRERTGVPLEIISGELEAEYMLNGVLNALEPVPDHALIVDVGGGSTEFVLCSHKEKIWTRSIPLGVVLLTEEYSSQKLRKAVIEDHLENLKSEMNQFCHSKGFDLSDFTLVGTAGTVTTLAALDMRMVDYDWRKINNYSLTHAKLLKWLSGLSPLCAKEREALPGMEAGRGDLVIPGLEIILSLMQKTQSDSLKVSDSGILEGLLVSQQNTDNPCPFH